MESTQLERINELAKLSKERPLTDAEKAEQSELRAKYIAQWRAATRQTLDNVYIVDSDGTKRKLEKREPK